MKRFLLILGLSAGFLQAQGPDTNSVSGVWNWDFTMPDATVVHPKVRLVHKDAQLTGVSLVRPGTEVAITNASVRGNHVQFDVVRVHHDVVTRTLYRGKWEGDYIRGTMQSDWSGTAQSYPWVARRHSSLSGNWKWTNRAFGARVETRAKLKFEDGKLTGSIRARDGKDLPIAKATFENGEVSFEYERERDGIVSLQIFKGVFEGGSIVGTVEYVSDAFPTGRKSEWKAERVE